MTRSPEPSQAPCSSTRPKARAPAQVSCCKHQQAPARGAHRLQPSCRGPQMPPSQLLSLTPATRPWLCHTWPRPTTLLPAPEDPLPPGVQEGSFSNQVPEVQELKAYCPGKLWCTATARQVGGTGCSLQGTERPLCGQSAEGRGASPELLPHHRFPAHSGQMAGYNGETGRSLNENIYCELQNKTQTPTGPNRREDSPGFHFQCGGSGRLASGRLMANVGGHRPGGSPPSCTSCTSASEADKSHHQLPACS